MSESLLQAEVPATEAPTPTADVDIGTPEPTAVEGGDAPTETHSVDQSVYDQMVPLFKQLNYTEDKASEVINKIAAGGDIADLSNDEGLIFGKYKDAMAAQEAFKSLESENGRLRREKSPEAPEEYAFDYSGDEDMAKIVPEGYDFDQDPLVQHMTPVFKEGKFTQDQVDMATKAWLTFQAEGAPNPKEEMAALGDNANSYITKVKSAVSGLSEDARAELEAFATTAGAVKALVELTGASAPKTIPTSNTTSAPQKSSAELYQEAFSYKNGVSNFSTNPDAQKVYDKMMDKALAVEEKGG